MSDRIAPGFVEAFFEIVGHLIAKFEAICLALDVFHSCHLTMPQWHAIDKSHWKINTLSDFKRLLEEWRARKDSNL